MPELKPIEDQFGKEIIPIEELLKKYGDRKWPYMGVTGALPSYVDYVGFTGWTGPGYPVDETGLVDENGNKVDKSGVGENRKKVTEPEGPTGYVPSIEELEMIRIAQYEFIDEEYVL